MHDDVKAILPVRNDMATMNANMERLAKASEGANQKMDALNTTTQAAPAAMKAAILDAWHTIALEMGAAIIVALLTTVALSFWKRSSK